MKIFSEIGSNSECKLLEIAKNVENKSHDFEVLDRPIAKDLEIVKERSVDGNSGNWTEEKGNSKWLPDNSIPSNPYANSDKMIGASEHKLSEIVKNIENKSQDINLLDKTIVKDSERVKGCPIDGNGGNWTGERGNSKWLPDNSIPSNPYTNPDKLTGAEICKKYKIDGVNFENGQPDFSEVSKGNVKIDNFTENRFGKGGNFDQATEKLSEQTGYSKSEIKEWMKDNKYTWHECNDCKTMQKVPTEVHGNISHSGGIAEIKSINNKEANI